MLAIIISRTVNNYNLPNSWKYDFRNASNYSFQTRRHVNNHILRNTSDECQQLKCLEMETNVNKSEMLPITIFRNVNKAHFHKCWRQMLQLEFSEMPAMNASCYIFRNAGDTFYQLENPEMLAINVINYNCQKCCRYTLAILISRNAGDICLQF